MIGAAMRGELDHVPTTKDTIFGLESPQSCPGVPSELLQPSKTWTDQEAYAKAAHNLADLFTTNFAPFENECSPAIMAGAPVSN
jgi:phosphoenolpyruvate carboxykinase (ATP)